MRELQDQRRLEYYQDKFAATLATDLAATLDRLDYPDYDPDRAGRITCKLLAQGRLAIAADTTKGICV